MPLRKSKSPAPGADRPSLAPPWVLLALAAMILLALVLVYPQKALLERIGRAPESELSSAYLGNLLRSNPDDPKLRLLVAAQALRHGETASLRSTLQPVLASGDPELQREAQWLLWQGAAREFRNLPPGATAERQAHKRQLSAQLARLAEESWPEERLQAMAEQAFEIGDTACALALYRKGASGLDDRDAARHYARGATIALSRRDYRSSAELSLLASARSPERREANAYRLDALRTLQSGNLLGDAVRVMEREIGDQENDPETLDFATRLARAAGRPDLADHYVRRLLRLTLLRQLEALRLAEQRGDVVAQKVSLRSEPGGGGPQLPFDDKTYTLGYEVFLENRKLDDAWKVATSAVRQAPADPAWRERLAKVAEWTSRPEQALEQWWHLARQTQRDDAWQAVLRLAPGLLNDRALLAALQYQITRQPDDFALYRQAIATWERLGEPLAALAFLEPRSRHGERGMLIEMMADLADRAGDPQRALQLWRRLFENAAEITPPRAVRAATLAALLDNSGEGLRWLEAAWKPAAPSAEDERERLRLTGQLALREQNAALAIRAYELIGQSSLAESGDFDALIAMSAGPAPQTAARAALAAWERFREPRHLIRALGFYAGSEQWPAIGKLLERLKPDAPPPYDSLPALRRDAEFLRFSAAYHHHVGQLREARRDLAAALALAPRSDEIRSSLLWVLIDSNDAPGLRRFLASHEPSWRANPAMHDALAAAYLALSRPQVALAQYLTPRFGEHENDFLWLMNYADALDQNQQSDRAWRLRRQLLSHEWRAHQSSQHAAGRDWLSDEALEEARRLARARLTMLSGNGDRSLGTLRELLRLDRERGQAATPAVTEMLIGWMQQAGEYPAERAYLWQQAARSLGKPANRPLWAEISVALADEDRSALHTLLDSHGERLPRYDRIRAASVLGALRAAQTDAFETQDQQPDDDPLHMQLAESLLAFSDHVGGQLASRKLGAIDELLASAQAHLALTPRLAMDLSMGQLRRAVNDPGAMRHAPDETFVSLRMDLRHDDGSTAFLIEQRRSLGDYTPLQVEHTRRIDDRLSLRIGFGQHLASLESTALRVAGMKDRALFALSYAPTRLDRLSVEQVVERYTLQTGAAVGRGNHTHLIYSHALRQENPNLEIGAFWSAHRFDRESGYADPALNAILPAGMSSVGELQPGFFLPDSFNFYGLRLSTDVRHEQAYTRALRPYASVARTWHSNLGPGYDLRVGVAGSVLGADHFSLTWGTGKAGLQVGGITREIQLNYRLHY